MSSTKETAPDSIADVATHQRTTPPGAEKEPAFSKDDVITYIQHGISEALKMLERDYETRLLELQGRLKRAEDSNNALRKELNDHVKKTEAKCTAMERDLEETKTQIKNQKISITKNENEINDLEQYSRRSHLRVRGWKVRSGETDKCAVVRLLREKLSMKDIAVTDLDAAHPLPHSNKNTPPPLIVRFHRRDHRDAALIARKKLKGSGITITEDLTRKNQELLRKLNESPDFTAAWSWMGKILAVRKGESKPTRYNISDDIPTRK